MDYLIIGQIVGVHGVRGEVRVSIETDDPERFAILRRVYLGDERRRFRVQGTRLHKGQALVKLVGVNDRDAADTLRGQWVYVAMEDALPLAEGEYYQHQIMGLLVVTDAGEELGRVAEILETGANDVYVVRGRVGELLLPAVDEVVLSVDLEAGRMTVHVPEGLR